ncbi:MAG TPA: signal peptide peptidase SppA [Steroidobacteraceae bacterium]|nr:signal peptide peptidase SppA [Steroidobacteraceae bacterium]
MASAGGFFRGVWRGLDVLRRILHLLLLLLIFGFIIGALRGGVPQLPARGALLIQPYGEIVEQRTGDPLTIAFNEARGAGQSETLLWDLTDAIRAAAGDDRVAAIALQLDYLTGAGQPTLEEVTAAMREFRASGKKIIAWGTSLTRARYYVAAHADEIYLDPMGEVLIDGYGQFRMYYKGLLDKLAVDVHLFRPDDNNFKTAAEDLVRQNMSPQDREASLAYLNALWDAYKKAVGEARGLDPEMIEQYASGYVDALRSNGGDSARVALEAGLVNGLRDANGITERLAELAGPDHKGQDYSRINYGDYVQLRHAARRLAHHGAGSVGVVLASGTILDGEQPSGTVGGATIAGLLRQAREDKDISAVVLRVDSPGGSALASEVILREVVALRGAGKPVVVSMGDLAASGGYYVAAPADRIFASATTLTGSIGVYAAIPTFNRTLDKVGVGVDGVGTTPLSGTMRIDRPMSPELRDYAQLSVQRIYDVFLGHVSDGRGKTREEAQAVAQGRVWIGSEAHRLGLVDTIGGYEDAVKAAAELAGLKPGYGVRRIEPRLTWAEQLAMQLRIQGARVSGAVLGPAVREVEVQAAPLALLQEQFDRIEALMSDGRPLAHCLCAAE